MADQETPIPGRRSRLRSDTGRGDINPYVLRISEFGPIVKTAEESEALSGLWRQEMALPESAPLLLEIGPGNGFFFRDLAGLMPDAGLIGMEIRFKRVWMTAKKATEAGRTNIRVVHHHAAWLGRVFAPVELDRIYLNHPDPWPKDRHHKHRLLQVPFVALLRGLLKPGGEFWIKSDFAPYGPLARELFAEPFWEEIGWTDDLYATPGPLLDGNIRTNYERKSLERGAKILKAGYRRR